MSGELTIHALREQGLFDELTRAFSNQPLAASVVLDVFSEAHPAMQAQIPTFSTPGHYWLQVLTLLEAGAVPNGMSKLLANAARVVPGNSKFARFATGGDVKGDKKRTHVAITIEVDGDLSDPEILKLVQDTKKFADDRDGRFHLDMVTKGSTKAHVFLELPPDVDAQEAMSAIRAAVPNARVYQEERDFRDYLLDPLYVEGPDGQRFAMDEVRASTRVSEVAESVMGEYEGSWPKGKAGEKPYTVDAQSPGGEPRRVRSNQTLHDAGVRPHDTLHVHPERRAGSVSPMLLAQSLTVVRNQILDHAKAHPEFFVEANSRDIPTEYVFHFRAPSFAPGNPPRRIEEHSVLLTLPAEFPVQAPRAFWQTDIFHPNIHFESGLVCLGVLTESYTPGLDFGVVCQMLVDMAGYRNYELTEGYNPEAARWAASEEGQKAIAEIGGCSIAELLGRTDRPARRLNLRRVKVGS